VKDMFQATVFSKITYCLPAWFGFCTAADSCVKLHRCVKQGFWSPSDMSSIRAITADIEDTLFNKIFRCDYHILSD